MAKSDEGEFELVLGNRQLVSVFLIVVILLGVFFSMGYIVGRNSAPAVTADAGSKPAAPTKPIVVESPTRTQQPIESASEVKPSPAPEEPLPEPKRSEPPPPERAPKEVPKHEPPKQEAPKPSPTAAGGGVSYEEPRAGQTFLQVLATDRADADAIAEMLVKRGFTTTVAPSSIPNKFRVLVGPTRGAADVSENRGKLEAAGFKPIVQRY